MNNKRLAVFKAPCPIYGSNRTVDRYEWVKDKEEAKRIAAVRRWSWEGFEN